MPKANYEAAIRQMITKDLIGRGICAPEVLRVMAQVPREEFLPDQLTQEVYADRALEIDCQQTISQPFIVALMSEALQLSGSEHVLEVGTGSGFQTAVLSRLAHDVVSIERYPRLSTQAAKVLQRLGCANVKLVIGDGTSGWPERAPYDRIIVTAAAHRCPPQLFAQLREGGILVAPIGSESCQTLQSLHKQNGRPVIRSLSVCRFVPLVGAEQPRP